MYLNGECPVDQTGCYMVEHMLEDEIISLQGCRMDGGAFGNTLGSSSSWSCSFIHVPSTGTQAAAQVGHV